MKTCKWLLILILGSLGLNSVQAQPATPEQIEKAREMMRQIQGGQTPAAPAPAAQPATPPVVEPAPVPPPTETPVAVPAAAPEVTPVANPCPSEQPMTADQETRARQLLEQTPSPAPPPAPEVTQPQKAGSHTFMRILFGKRCRDPFSVYCAVKYPAPGTAALARANAATNQPAASTPLVMAKAAEPASTTSPTTTTSPAAPTPAPSEAQTPPAQEEKAKDVGKTEEVPPQQPDEQE